MQNVFSFNENDVIEVDLNAPAEPEWFFGTCQGRAGLFPQGMCSDWLTVLALPFKLSRANQNTF